MLFKLYDMAITLMAGPTKIGGNVLRWGRGREVHAQVMLSLPLGLQESSRTRAHGKETKCTQLVNSTTWLNKQFPH